MSSIWNFYIRFLCALCRFDALSPQTNRPGVFRRPCGTFNHQHLTVYIVYANICIDTYGLSFLCGFTPVVVYSVKVQFRELRLYNKKGALFQDGFYQSRICRSSYLNLHTFHLIFIVFCWRISFRQHGKSIPNDRQYHHVDVVMMTSQCRCTRALNQSHVAKHDSHVQVTPLIGSVTLLSCRMAKPYRQKH